MQRLAIRGTRVTKVGIISLIVAALTTAACGGGQEDTQATPKAAQPEAAASPGQGSFDPCTLFTADEVQATLGWKPAKSERFLGQVQGTGHCKYTGEQGAAPVPQLLDVGIGVCPTNMPCTSLPDFANSEEMAAYRKKGYEGQTGGAFSGMKANISAIEGMGVPAIEHELASLIAIEMFIGQKKLAYVETWAESKVAREMAAKVLSRAR